MELAQTVTSTYDPTPGQQPWEMITDNLDFWIPASIAVIFGILFLILIVKIVRAKEA